MNLESIVEIFWLVSRPGPTLTPQPTDCLGGTIANQTIVCSELNSILPIMFMLIPILIIVRVLSSFLSDHVQPHSRNDTCEDDKGDSFLHRLFYRKRKREEDGDSRE